ncbi:MAG: DUF1592 domain-containing protein [Planctomycetaceae bacterium]|nr:DUF1592 domain-containing protein [Planctomycetaceae bacterium]
MKSNRIWCFIACLLISNVASGELFRTEIQPLINSSCVECHDADTSTSLNFESIGNHLADPTTFRRWETIYDRIENGEMPPKSEPRPDSNQRDAALASLRQALRSASLNRQQTVGRVPARRLTKLEIGYTLRDLLLIDGDVTSEIPNEVESGSFDTVGSNQRISALHLESYIKAADQALDLAINLNRNPYRSHDFDFPSSWFLKSFHEKPLSLGGNVTREIDDGVALFADIDYLLRSDAHGFPVRVPGVYRIKSKVAAFQSKDPITFKLISKEPSGGAQLLTSCDLVPGKSETVEVTAYLKPGDAVYPTFDTSQSNPYGGLAAAGGAKNYRGEGLAILGQQIEGPLADQWPPASTERLLHGTTLAPSGWFFKRTFEVKLSKPALDHIQEILEHFAPRVFRRPFLPGELDAFTALAKPAIEEERKFVDALRIPLLSMLSSTQFLMFENQPGKLNDHALANRLSYFLWKSLPDEKLFSLADQNKLSDPDVLTQQVNRMLDDPKSERFVKDFLGQWLMLNKLNATTPDSKLYPEYDELLGNALAMETELFFTELLKENLSIATLLDSDFIFANRRLANHYGIPDIAGQEFRKIFLPNDSPRGGILTQAAILKTTANGTVTSPVMRGNFVLTNLLGTPPSPPPPAVGSIEPDTRGKTTIRETLAAHQNNETCASCHRSIDPPGFALESFDPIGGFRTNYRTAGGGLFSFFTDQTYRDGPVVDASGVTADGKTFSGINEFKQHLFGQKEQLAKHFVSQLVVYSTGGQIQFADRDEIQEILNKTCDQGYPIRDLLHEVVQSKLFQYQ